MVSTQAAGLEEHGLDQVTDGMGRWLGGGGAAGKGVNKTLEHLDGAGLAGLEGEALASVILVGDTVQRRPLLLQPGQYPRFIGRPWPARAAPDGAVHQGALRRLLREGQKIETEQTVTLVMLYVGAEHSASQRAWRLVHGRHYWELRGAYQGSGPGCIFACSRIGGAAPGARPQGERSVRCPCSDVSSHSRWRGSPCTMAHES